MVEMEDEGKSSCEKLRVVLAVLLVVAVCQHTPLEIEIKAKAPSIGISYFQDIFAPSFGRPSRVGGLPINHPRCPL